MSSVDDAVDDDLRPSGSTAADTWVDWPEMLQSGSYSDIPHGQCPHLAREHTDDSPTWARHAIDKLLKDPDFRVEYERILALAGPPQPHHWRVVRAGGAPVPGPYPEEDGEDVDGLTTPGRVLKTLRPEEHPDLWDAHVRRRERIRQQSAEFGTQFRFRFASPSIVSWVMEAVLEQGEPLRFESIAGISKTLAEEYAGSLPTVFVNPLPDQDLSLSVSPGRILVDVIHASSDDLAALATLLSDVQARLDYRKMRGRPPELNEEQMTFVHDLRTTPTGRAKLRSWHTVVRLFNARFTQDISETTLKQRYRRWTQATGVDTKIAQH